MLSATPEAVALLAAGAGGVDGQAERIPRELRRLCENAGNLEGTRRDLYSFRAEAGRQGTCGGERRR